MLEVLRRVGFFPRACVWELTLACNMRCKHCGSIAGSKRSDEMSLDENLRVADELAALGCKRVTLSGGEPTLHPAWFEIGRRLTSNYVRTNLISNGWTWSARHVDQARDAGLCGAAFSLDGFESEHDDFRTPGSYARVVNAIDTSVAMGFPIAINTTINRLNQGLLPRLRQFLIDHGVFAWQLQFATATGNMGQHQDMVVDPKDLLWLVPQIAELCRQNTREFQVHASDDVGYYGQAENDLRSGDASMPFWMGCRAGCQVVGIESNGTVKGCLSLPSSMCGESRFIDGNLRKNSLREIWNRTDAFAYNRQFTPAQLTGFCRVCRFGDLCRGGCSWARYTHCRAGGVGNEMCFYYQAVKHRRHELLDEPPTSEELRYFEKDFEAAT